jgi:hypothetical protein
MSEMRSDNLQTNFELGENSAIQIETLSGPQPITFAI